MKAQSTMKLKHHAFFYFFPSWEYVFSNHRQFFEGEAPLCLSHTSHCYIWSFNCCGHGYSNMAKVPLSCSTATLTLTSTSTLYLEALLRPVYLSLSAFHFHIFTHKFLRSTLFNQIWYSLSLCHSFLCLGSPYHPTANAKPLVSIQCLQHSPKSIQNIKTSWLSWHMNMPVIVS
jgi:hypothetical protein